MPGWALSAARMSRVLATPGWPVAAWRAPSVVYTLNPLLASLPPMPMTVKAAAPAAALTNTREPGWRCSSRGEGRAGDHDRGVGALVLGAQPATGSERLVDERGCAHAQGVERLAPVAHL